MPDYVQQNTEHPEYTEEAVRLLKQLISIPSFSKEEHKTADALVSFFSEKGIEAHRVKNNVWVQNASFSPDKPTLLLNSHHDTVCPNAGYTLDPFDAVEKDGRLYGLGSNDAGASLVSMLLTFMHFYQGELPCNLVFAASAEEEISGANGMELLLSELPPIDFAIVGEPTQMRMAVAEKGLMVLDCEVVGQAGHAARDEGTNAIYLAMDDISWFRNYRFPKISEFLGPVHMAVTSVETPNKAHNMVPDICRFMVDIRVNELYAFEEILSIISNHVQCQFQPRSQRLKPSGISTVHPLVMAGTQCGLLSFGSPTLSDMALMPFPALKMGPGDSARSHTADEYIFVKEIEEGIQTYIRFIYSFLTEISGTENTAPKENTH